MATLRPDDRALLDWVNRAAFSNPFSEERDRADRAITDQPVGSDQPTPSIDEVEARVRGCLARVLAGDAQLGAYAAEDHERLEHALLFQVFHESAAVLDALIERQAGNPKPVGFAAAADILRALTAHGMAPARARRALELFYQMRRAFVFISGGLVGDAPSLRRLREALWAHVFTHDVRRYERFLWDRMEDFSTLLEGETGSGKGAAAAALGRSGYIAWDDARGRFEASYEALFIAVNLSEFSASLVESELFGHRKGAFTGAVDAHQGLLARCPPHGVVFLDEIAEVSPELQVKLLRVLQDRTFTPVGDRAEQRFVGRVVAATHAGLDALRAEGRFRDDLFYRLCSDRVRVPSLRARLAEDPAELGRLVTRVVARIVGGPQSGLAAEVLAAIERDVAPGYAWPGNVRELEQCVRRVLLMGTAQVASASAPAAEPASRFEEAPWLASVQAGALDARSVLAQYCGMLYARLGSYEDVARVTGLDRRTVKKYAQQQSDKE
jgi:transcriptional regulator with AAA-type ATPase domain